MVRGLRTFKDFLGAGEGIATNILADRLRNLEGQGILTAEAEQRDGRKVNYRLTAKGIDLAPVLLDLLIWGGAAPGNGGAVRTGCETGGESPGGVGRSQAPVAGAGCHSANPQIRERQHRWQFDGRAAGAEAYR